jgi:hypothetical protein
MSLLAISSAQDRKNINGTFWVVLAIAALIFLIAMLYIVAEVLA